MKTDKTSEDQLANKILKLLQDYYLRLDGSVKPINTLYKEEQVSKLFADLIDRMLIDCTSTMQVYEPLMYPEPKEL